MYFSLSLPSSSQPSSKITSLSSSDSSSISPLLFNSVSETLKPSSSAQTSSKTSTVPLSTSMRSSQDTSTHSSSTSSPSTTSKASITDSSSSSSIVTVSSTIRTGDRTYTSLVTVATNLSSSNSGSSGGNHNNGRLIGGLVGSIGGAILIGLLAAVFLILRKKRKYVNPSPDYNDVSAGEPKRKRSLKIASFFKRKEKGTTGGAAPQAAENSHDPFETRYDYDGIENSSDDGYQYRGQTNGNYVGDRVASARETSHAEPRQFARPSASQPLDVYNGNNYDAFNQTSPLSRNHRRLNSTDSEGIFADFVTDESPLQTPGENNGFPANRSRFQEIF